jgi:hypothetical protein
MTNPATKPVTIEYVQEEGRRYAVRNGQRIEVESSTPKDDLPPTKREAFEPEFAKLPIHWVKALRRAKNINTCPLAHAIQLEVFQCGRMGGEIVLSAEMTGIASRPNRYRAAKELEQLGLIKLSRKGNQALRVIIL